MVNACLHCGKYIFNEENVNKHKRMTMEEYINGVYRKNIRTNDPVQLVTMMLELELSNQVNKSACELCGAPHAIFSNDAGEVSMVKFFFSTLDKPSEKDVQFINHFRRDFFGR